MLKHIERKVVAERERQPQVTRDSVMTSCMDSRYDSQIDATPGTKTRVTGKPGKF